MPAHINYRVRGRIEHSARCSYDMKRLPQDSLMSLVAGGGGNWRISNVFEAVAAGAPRNRYLDVFFFFFGGCRLLLWVTTGKYDVPGTC